MASVKEVFRPTPLLKKTEAVSDSASLSVLCDYRDISRTILVM